MELEWDSRPVSIAQHPRDWHDRSQPTAGPSKSVTTYTPTPSQLAQRRRSSAAHTRPAGPPPNLPIPNIPSQPSSPPQSHSLTPEPHDPPYHSHNQINGTARSTSSNTFTRPAASANLTAVAAFSSRHAPSAQSLRLSNPPTIDPLDVPPCPAFPQSSPDPSDRALLTPPETRPNQHRPSSRRALMKALELAKEAVSLDSTNDDPWAAVQAYGKSVALLSEVMERVQRGEDSTEPHRKRNGRRRSIVAQEEEVRRLKSIHDTYADRMNILSLIYSIPPMPHSTASIYSNMSVSTDSTQPSSPTNTSSPTSETSETMRKSFTSSEEREEQLSDQHTGHERNQEGVDSVGSAMFGVDKSNQAVTVAHPYATPSHYEAPQSQPYPPVNPSPNRTSVLSRRARSGSASIPPPAPPPAITLPSIPPAAPNDIPREVTTPQSQRHLDVMTNRQRGNSVGHQRTSSGGRLAALQEENERYEDAAATPVVREEGLRSQLLNTPRNTAKHDSHPLPPLPSQPSPATTDTETPRNSVIAEKAPPSPRLSNLVARQRGVSQPPVRSESAGSLINATTSQGTISQRRSKMSTTSTPRSSSPTGSTTSAGSVPLSKPAPSSLPPMGSAPIMTRNRAFSQPGQRPSGRMSPDRPPLPVSAGISQRKASFPSKFLPGAQPPPLTVQTDLPPSSSTLTAVSLIPPPPVLSGNLPTTPPSPLPPTPPNDPLRKPYHMMHLLLTTMTSPTGGYVTRRLHVPHEVWSQGGAKLSNVPEKVRVVEILCSALEDLQLSSSEYFGAGNVSSGLALGIGSIGRKEGEAWTAKLEEFSSVCDGVVANFGKRLGVGEGFVLKKNTGVSTWLTRRLDKFTNGKNLDSPAAYVQGLKQLFQHAQLLDEHAKAVVSQPIAPAYAAFPSDIRSSVEAKLRRSSEFFASVILTFVIRDLSQLLDKYAKKCEKWLAE